MKNILVTGATGNLGSKVSAKLAESGNNVFAAGRNIDKIEKKQNLTPVKFDYEQPAQFREVLKDVDSVSLVAPSMDPFSDQKLIPFIDTAIESGVNFILLNTALGIDMAPDSGLYKVEQHLMKSGIDYAIIRPNFFMENFTAGFIAPMIQHKNGIFLAAGKGKTSFIAVDDIADCANAILNNIENFKGQAYNLTGVDILDHYEVAAIISEISGKNISYVELSMEDMKQGALDNGMPEPSVEMMCALYGTVSAGYTAGVTDDVEKIIGRKPLPFDEYIDNKI